MKDLRDTSNKQDGFNNTDKREVQKKQIEKIKSKKCLATRTFEARCSFDMQVTLYFRVLRAPL